MINVPTAEVLIFIVVYLAIGIFTSLKIAPYLEGIPQYKYGSFGKVAYINIMIILFWPILGAIVIIVLLAVAKHRIFKTSND